MPQRKGIEPIIRKVVIAVFGIIFALLLLFVAVSKFNAVGFLG